jgi:hypothetical protein
MNSRPTNLLVKRQHFTVVTCLKSEPDIPTVRNEATTGPYFNPFEFSLPPCTIILRHFPVCAYALHVVSSNFVEKMLKPYYFLKKSFVHFLFVIKVQVNVQQAHYRPGQALRVAER